jgi:hypothetical protein
VHNTEREATTVWHHELRQCQQTQPTTTKSATAEWLATQTHIVQLNRCVDSGSSSQATHLSSSVSSSKRLRRVRWPRLSAGLRLRLLLLLRRLRSRLRLRDLQGVQDTLPHGSASKCLYRHVDVYRHRRAGAVMGRSYQAVSTGGSGQAVCGASRAKAVE